MFETGALVFLYTETPCHAGAGDSATVDLAIQRNPTLGLPIVQGSGLKGSWRDTAPRDGSDAWWKRQVAFGPDSDDKRGRTGDGKGPGAEDFGGALSVGDAAVLAFPVASLAGIFGWVTCRQAIRDFQRTWAFLPRPAAANESGAQEDQPPAEGQAPGGNGVTGIDPYTWQPPKVEDGQALWLADCGLTIDQARTQLVLQDLLLTRHDKKDDEDKDVEHLGQFAGWLSRAALPDQPPAVQDKLRHDLVLVSDNVFKLLVEAGIHVITRVKIDDNTGTAAQSGPWDEELLPAETVLYAPVMAGSPRDAWLMQERARQWREKPIFRAAGEVLAYFTDQVIRRDGTPWRFQLGGDATVGRGWVYPAVCPGSMGPSANAGSATTAGQGGQK